MENWQDTVISQYKNSPTINRMLLTFDECVDPSVDIDRFYNLVWNVDTAQGYGLDVWGRIVGVGRILTIDGGTFFGFSAANDSEGFDQEPFWNEVPGTDNYILTDIAYRQLILMKAAANIARTDSKSINSILCTMFSERGNVFVTDTGNMSSRFVFNFFLEPYEIAIIKQSGCLPRSAGVKVGAMQIDPAGEFGFSEAYDTEGFGNGTFFNELIPVSG